METKNVAEENYSKMEKLEQILAEEGSQMLSNTSCLAIGNIFIRKNPLLKTLWCIAFILCTAMTIKQIYSLSVNYYSYNYNTVIKLQLYRDEFPSITLCNLNPIRKSQVYLGKPRLQNFLHDLEVANFTKDNLNEMDKRLKNEFTFTRLLANESSEVRFQMGHQLKDFILQCYFLGMKCDLTKLFTHFITNKFGNCYMFNPKLLLKNMSQVDNINRSKGLFLTLYVQNMEYLPNLIPNSGIRIHLQPADSIEIPDDYGMTLPTGFQVSFGLVPTKIKRLKEITGNCEEGKYFKKRFNAIYTKESCYIVCLNEIIFAQCGCYDPTFQIFQQNISNFICNEDSQIDCYLSKTFNFDVLKEKCKCLGSCDGIIYDVKQSFSTWPASSYEKRFFDDLSDIYPNFYNLTKKEKDNARQNFTNLVIYVEDRSHKEIYQIRAYQWDSFLSDIGGTLSLYLGFSILTGFEFIETVALLTLYLFGKIIYRKNE